MEKKSHSERKIRPLFLVVISALIFGMLSLVLFFPKNNKQLTSIEVEYQMYCGSCHIAPNPAHIPKSIWENNVLPEMAARMGYRYNDFNPYKYSIEENHYVRLSNTYPETPMLDSVTWKRLHDYVIGKAPDSVQNVPTRKGRASMLFQFDPRIMKVNNNTLTGGVINVKIDGSTGRIMIGDVFGQIHEWKKSPPVDTAFESPVVSSVIDQGTLYLTEIGIMGPSEIPKGKLYNAGTDTIALLLEKLHRPVYTQILDLNEDGQKEIIVCEFGHHTGELSLFVKKDSTYKKRTLLALPGSIKVEVLDMDDDGKKDIVALFSQGREGIYVFYQKDNLSFNMEQVIGLSPEHGLSWFSILDYNKDGHADIVVANGDNADYSNFLKPYHGVRLYLNNGENEFSEKWFYPINGATRVLADDFDLDGDVDFAVMSFFPDFSDNPEEGFVYLENQDSESYTFRPYVTQEAMLGNWLVMDKGDLDYDGDIDLLLGNFNLLRDDSFRQENDHDLLYLENTTIQND
ncbi:FG-GAP repeat domain-containing protein [Flagellimonas sp.]|uniref:FG-GAP repeat domain-containing protein n=1 Tax=Flagellimonas sp. TaxID=2058762 RepID=UPI003BB1E96A